jgi:hypothetical protein
LPLAGFIGLAYAIHAFGWAFFGGGSPFWDIPSAVQGSRLDIQTTLSGYYWFAQQPWQWPLLSLINPDSFEICLRRRGLS